MKEVNKVLIVGYGSIGKRHTKILQEFGYSISVVSRRNLSYPNTYTNIKEAIIKEDPDYVVIANETSKHEESLLQLERIGFNSKILVEKPLFHNKPESDFNFKEIYIGYNLRFHPIIEKLYSLIKGENILSVQAYVGQYLPSWRPGTNYKKSYSSDCKKGGGVIRDLSHELDYLEFLFGKWRSLVAHGGKFSELDINSDDTFALIFKTDNCPLISLQMNYLDYISQRYIIINTNKGTYKADLVNNSFSRGLALLG